MVESLYKCAYVLPEFERNYNFIFIVFLDYILNFSSSCSMIAYVMKFKYVYNSFFAILQPIIMNNWRAHFKKSLSLFYEFYSIVRLFLQSFSCMNIIYKNCSDIFETFIWLSFIFRGRQN